jgi:hypothetical protein
LETVFPAIFWPVLCGGAVLSVRLPKYKWLKMVWQETLKQGITFGTDHECAVRGFRKNITSGFHLVRLFQEGRLSICNINGFCIKIFVFRQVWIQF